jgi:hypothetical protein
MPWTKRASPSCGKLEIQDFDGKTSNYEADNRALRQ